MLAPRCVATRHATLEPMITRRNYYNATIIRRATVCRVNRSKTLGIQSHSICRGASSQARRAMDVQYVAGQAKYPEPAANVQQSPPMGKRSRQPTSFRRVEGQGKSPNFDVNGQQWPPKRKRSRHGLDGSAVRPPTDQTEMNPPRYASNSLAGLLPLAIRDMCYCPRCVDPSSKQRLFSTFDIPSSIEFKTVNEDDDDIKYTWRNDIKGYLDHTTVIPKSVVAELSAARSPVPLPRMPPRTFWDDEKFSKQCENVDFEHYMHDDHVLYRALRQLHTHGLLFLTGVPPSPESVSQIAERIGPLKNTFYGPTWDVRSVPQAKNVAYTSQDLGFHMDLLYMEQPPHLQFLHCIRSSAKGGASLFTDSFKAASDMYHAGSQALWKVLTKTRVTHHYNHLESHFYEQSRPTIELAPLRLGGRNYNNLSVLHEDTLNRSNTLALEHFNVEDFIEGVSWSPPFQAPFRLDSEKVPRAAGADDSSGVLNQKIATWHKAAKAFNELIQRDEGIHERMMKPGECVLFDNRRVLHARRAFEVDDEGSERWLRGAYVDKDPFVSKLRVFMNRFGDTAGSTESTVPDIAQKL